jgi:hypothetical protein
MGSKAEVKNCVNLTERDEEILVKLCKNAEVLLRFYSPINMHITVAVINTVIDVKYLRNGVEVPEKVTRAMKELEINTKIYGYPPRLITYWKS